LAAVFVLIFQEVRTLSEYRTVKCAAEAVYEDHRSKFIGAIVPVTTEQEALNFLSERKQNNFGARHNVYAYILRENNICRYSDDGEPHSTAGIPTLDVLKKNNLTDVCVVTTRYFGGVLLGTGGLVRAYTAAAKMAVEAAGIAIMRECNICEVSCSYSDHRLIEQLLKDNGAKIIDTIFAENIKVSFSIEQKLYDIIENKITDVFCGRISPIIVNVDYAEV
jgi:uncharacterized YigZ family protein